ncbi:alpha/beta hydrolase family protein, partial [Gemmatimonadota bacterium]
QGESRALLTGVGNYERWVMNEDETHLAFLTDRDDYEADPSTYNLYGWKVGDPAAALWVSHTSTPGFPAGMSVSSLTGPSFTEDGSIVLFGIKEKPEPEEEPVEDEEAEEEEEEEVAEFELWSWNDPYPYPQQKLMADRINNQTFESVYHVGTGRFVQLADEDLPDVSLHRSGKIAYGQTDLPYTQRISYDSSYYDYYLIDPMTGERTKVVEENYNRISLSPLAGYAYWWGTDRHWHIYNVATGTTTNLTYDLPVPVWNREDDSPQPRGNYGIAGWTDGEATVLLYDEFDIWEMKPDGSEARCITEGFGRAGGLQFRYQRMDPDERTITPNEWMMLRTTNRETMASGYYRDRVTGSREPQMLHMGDYSYGRSFQQADDTDAILTTRSTFYEFPDLWLTSTSFDEWEKISDVGAQRDQFIWGQSELVSYVNAWGAEYKGILTKPENFDPNRKYPMLVYIYETLTSGLHSFRAPSPGTSINLSYYVSNGYVIWQPDIYYGTGHPGPDAVDCVVPSIEKILSLGFVDPERVGLQGHSWGGYQGAYMITQTDIFAAIESGAPVSNMTSAYGGIRWGSGMVRQFQYEHTQSRLGRTLWDGGLMRYIENSPVFFADKINTPVLILHNDQDDAVPWYQGIEFIMALRRLEKPAWMFNYPGERHGLRQRVNMKDYTIKMQEFFDHYLKGTPMPDWMENGIQAWEKE